MSTAPVPSPQKRPNTVAWVFGTIGGLLVILVGFGLIAGFFVIRNFRVQDNGKEVQIHIPGADLKVNKTGAADVDLPVYPGASVGNAGDGGGGVDVQFARPGGDPVGFSVAKYMTDDSLDKIEAWYRDHLGAEFELKGPGGSFELPRLHHIELEHGDLAFVRGTATADRVVVLAPRFSHVEIVLLRAGAPVAQ